MLLNEKEVRDNIRNRDGKRVFYLAKGDQLTSSARDYLSRERIEILPAEQARQDRYQLLNGGYLEEKPEHMTHLNAQVLVEKSHPRILFRGKLDTLEAELILCQQAAEHLTASLGEVLSQVRRLILEDPENPLTCGIEIRVQPPGKQVKTITLLSGGEKAFVAIALYFAILKVRPTPFCMLDEIDAALDDRNVERFANYLDNLSKKTQFIVITHRRGTMEASDVLYGVTMQEQGVSKLLRLDLNQMEEYLGIVE